MLKSPKFWAGLTVSTCLLAASALAGDGKLGLGREATTEEVQAWNIDVRPDGQGLPVGKGTVSDGEQIYSDQCAACHGVFGEGVDRWPVLAGGSGTLKGDDPVKTVGSYWPYLSTVYDYIKRAMPFGNAQSLSNDDVYALTAYILYLNDVVSDESFELSNENFASVKLPNEENFISDSRPDTATLKKKEPCMSDCKPEVKITGRARILDVTPDQEDKAGQTKID